MTSHEDYLQEAVRESRRSVEAGSSPFGAVIVRDGQIVARAHNTVVPDNDPTAHAEVNCIRVACQVLNTFDLTGCVLYTSCEPCPMCLNAAKWANISDIYYAADRHDAEAIGFRDRVFYDEDPLTLKRIQLTEARAVMDEWFHRADKKEY